MSIALNTHDLERQQVAFADDVARMADAAVYQLRNVDQALDGALDASERAERYQLRHEAGDDLPLLVLVDHSLPLFGVGPPDAEGDFLVLGVDLRNVDVDLIADLEQIGGGLVAVPGQLGEVREAVGSS